MTVVTEYILLTLTAVFSSILFVLCCYVKWTQTYWEKKGVRTPISYFPYGHIKEVFFQEKCIGEQLKKIYNDLKWMGLKYGGYYSFTKPIFVPVDLDLIGAILGKDFNNFMDHSHYVNPKISILSDHLFNLRGNKWRRMRAKLTPTFTSGKVKMMLPNLLKCAEDLDRVIEKIASGKKVLNVKDISFRFTADVIMSCAFGKNGDCLLNPDSEFRTYGSRVFELTFRTAIFLFLIMHWPEMVNFLKIDPIRKDVSDYFRKIINDAVEERERKNIVKNDFLQCLIQLKNNVDYTENGSNFKSDDEEPLTLDELSANAFLFLIAGFETSSTTTTFCLYELATNPEIQEKVREEILNCLKDRQEITDEILHEMTYLEQCINETLRKYPPVSFYTRKCTQTYKISESNLKIQKGENIFISVLGIHRDPEYYRNPDRFDPDRFLPENIQKRHPSAYIPFGSGPRLCLGLRFGVTQTKVALITLLRKYKFSINTRTKIPLEFDPKCVILTAEGNVWLNCEKI